MLAIMVGIGLIASAAESFFFTLIVGVLMALFTIALGK